LRKISLVVQMSDPEDYEGGSLELNTGGPIVEPTKTKGSVIIFPSYLLHRVTPVTSGLRKSLVLWAGGSSLK
jgi:PKHD-type hydroxylase